MKKRLRLLIIFIFFGKQNVVFASRDGGNSQCYQIDTIEIQGVYSLSQREVRRIKDTYQGQCLKLADIKNLVGVITNIYIDNGYITTRAYVPEQNLLERKLIINVYEGMLENIEHVNGKVFWNNILPLDIGGVVNLRDIEQGVDNINKTREATIQLKPGEKDGSTIAVIDNKPSKGWSFSSGVDNLGSKNKGRYQSFTNFSFGNLFSLNESYLFGYRASLDDGNGNKGFTRSYNIVVSGAYKYSNFMLQYNDASYKTLISTPKNKYLNSGGSKVSKIIVDRVVHRDGKSKSSINIGAGFDDYSNYIADNKIETSTYRIRKFDAGIRHQRRLNASSASFNINFTAGHNLDYYRMASSMMKTPAKKFTKFNYGFSWILPLGMISKEQFMKYFLQVNGQYSPKMLVATEKDTVGGLSSVRGFQDYVENSDNSLILRNEINVNLPNLSKIGKVLFGSMDLFGAYDLGKFRNYEDKGIRKGVMSGIATGIRSSSGYCNVSITVALPLESPIPINRRKVVYMSVSINL